ncbi:MAG: 1-deoxy-D-xylulose-5-phosphate reductoisomerase [Rhodobiaceae bacterium]|nr:1-deoxy-D-xylulose-5-phosphate reductoisomerase [Rhodobiaceae bacterium]MCC0057500.1 1-deoxy-D-xylulose-5-phosphate reductoisomerase [Rhodobiaceae bacterium]
MRTITILGATGSIGRNVADIVERHPDRFSVDAVASGNDVDTLASMAMRLNASFAAVADPQKGAALKDALSGSGIASGAGEGAVIEAASRQEADIVVGAIVGAAGLAPTLAAIRRGARVALANKECLVCAGSHFMAEAARCGAEILPVDSEHSAVFQALDGSPLERIREVVLTASGGPFRKWSADALERATLEDALNHPTWSMGAKVTIDSATLMNKGLELIEAHHLFALPPQKLGVVIQPQSIVHALVAYVDGSVVAQLGMPDMRAPIAYALGYPERIDTPVASLDLAALSKLEFEAPDRRRFPAIDIAMSAMEAGDSATAAFNAANEVAVAAFLTRRLRFVEIARIVGECTERHIASGAAAIGSLEDAMAVDRHARRVAGELVEQSGG